MTTVNCLRRLIDSGQRRFPIYIGFLAAADILALAEAPSFSINTDHQQIATNILTPPIKDWQRPLDEDRVQRISLLFNNMGEFMPNPVLLCENVTSNERRVELRQQTVAQGVTTELWEVDIQAAPDNGAKPLWILDGQHRINGLARSPQSANNIPVVLLLGQAEYSGSLLAKLFAQVTTSATKLDELHNEWLTFAFRLGAYASISQHHDDHRSAMNSVAELCRTPELPAGQTNPFCSQVRFNIHRVVSPAHGGFAYTCIELKELIRANYYAEPATTLHLSAIDLASEIARSYRELHEVVVSPNTSVFFGGSEYGQRIMQDAFLVGVFRYLLTHGRPESWRFLFETLQFRETDWNFKNWVRTLNGSAQSTSKRLAVEVFSDVFRVGALPEGAGTLSDFLKGNNARVDLTFSPVTAAGRPLRTNQQRHQLVGGARLTFAVAPRRHVKVSGMSKNIGKLTVSDKQSPPGRLVEYQLQRGLVLAEHSHVSPLSLLLRMEHYGGLESTADVEVRWKE
jgi:hypothetical protein